MQYLSELPEISSIGVDGDIISLELEQRIEELPDLGDSDPVVLTAHYAGQIVVAVGQVIEHKNIEGKSSVLKATDVWCRIKIKGLSVTFTPAFHWRIPH